MDLQVTTFDEYSETNATGVKINYKDKRVPFVPQHTLSANADYLINVDPAALLDPTNKFHLRSVTVGLNMVAQGKTYLGRTKHNCTKLLCHSGRTCRC